MTSAEEKYKDIIRLEQPRLSHQRMERINRAAQFAPFAALTGFEDEIEETGRYTSSRVELTEDSLSEINQGLTELYSREGEMPPVRVHYFEADRYKQGGKYLEITSRLLSIDKRRKQIQLENGTVIAFSNIKELEVLG